MHYYSTDEDSSKDESDTIDSEMSSYGTVHEQATDISFEWKLNFLALPQEAGTCCNSPSFSFAGEQFHLVLFPNGDPEDNSVGQVELYLCKQNSDYGINLLWTFALKTFDGKMEHEVQYSHFFVETPEEGIGPSCFIKRSELLERKSVLMPCDVLTIVFCVQYYSRPNNDAETAKLVEDLRNLVDNPEYSDIIIKVKEEEFRLHKSILAARNPYFNAMFRNDMKEKQANLVPIDDCDLSVFRSFINFLYTGKVQELSSDNVCALYEAADKFLEDMLKMKCLDFISGVSRFKLWEG